MLDIAGYRADMREELVALAEETSRVKDSGEPVELEPMSPFERKVVHDAVGAAGLSSESEGVEPRRFVVVLPAMTDRDDSVTDGFHVKRPPRQKRRGGLFSSERLPLGERYVDLSQSRASSAA